MGFDVLPQVDNSAINDQKGQQRLQGFFSEQYSFRARKQEPDNGSDYHVELLKEGATNKEATHKEFTLQLKSKVKPTFVKNGTYLSCKFPTSRLRYLLNNEPQWAGLIVVYDVTGDKLYFDYITDIYTRLIEEQGTDEWRANDDVTIHLPVVQELTVEQLPLIHSHFLQLFKNMQRMQKAFGTRYGLPLIPVSADNDFDLNDPEFIKSSLKQLGRTWLSQRYTVMVADLLGRLEDRELTADKDLLMLNAACKSLIGRATESMYLLTRCQNKFQLTDTEKNELRFTELRNQFNLNKISADEFIQEWRQMLLQIDQMPGQLELRINILAFTLAGWKLLEPIPDSLVAELADIKEKIELVQDEKQKNQLKLSHIANVGTAVGYNHYETIHEAIASSEVEGTWVTLPTIVERKANAKTRIQLQLDFAETVQEVREFAIKSNDRLLCSDCDATYLRFYLDREINLLTVHSIRVIHEQERKVYASLLHYAYKAIHVYEAYRHLREAYTTAVNLLDLLYIFQHAYGVVFSAITVQKVIDIKEILEQELELGEQVIPMVAPDLIRSLNPNTEKGINKQLL